LAGLVASAVGLAIAVMPRHFTAAEQQKIMSWEAGKRWRTWPAGRIFPASVTYRVPGQVLASKTGLSLPAHRVGIAPEAPCATASDRPAARVLARYGCTAVLRATYADATGAFVVTIGVAVLHSGPDGAAGAAGAQPAMPGSGNLRPGVRVAAFPGTLTAPFANRSRQVSSSIAAGPYLVMYAAGYADGRPHLKANGDSYAEGELLTASEGIAGYIASRLGAPAAPAHCPGTPGC
jgi:hypothetical protein